MPQLFKLAASPHMDCMPVPYPLSLVCCVPADPGPEQQQLCRSTACWLGLYAAIAAAEPVVQQPQRQPANKLGLHDIIAGP